VLRSRVYDYRHHCPGGRPRHFKVKDRVVDLDVSRHEVYVRGDVRVALFDYDVGKGDDHMGHVVFNTAFIESNYLAFEKVSRQLRWRVHLWWSVALLPSSAPLCPLPPPPPAADRD